MFNNLSSRPQTMARGTLDDRNKLSITIEMIEAYCISRLTWEEAKPFVDFLEKVYGFIPPPKVKASIRRIYQKFDHKIHGKSIIAKKVDIGHAKIGAMNKFTRNKQINLGDINGNERTE